jgi:hypothetical protein
MSQEELICKLHQFAKLLQLEMLFLFFETGGAQKALMAD